MVPHAPRVRGVRPAVFSRVRLLHRSDDSQLRLHHRAGNHRVPDFALCSRSSRSICEFPAGVVDAFRARSFSLVDAPQLQPLAFPRLLGRTLEPRRLVFVEGHRHSPSFSRREIHEGGSLAGNDSSEASSTTSNAFLASGGRGFPPECFGFAAFFSFSCLGMARLFPFVTISPPSSSAEQNTDARQSCQVIAYVRIGLSAPFQEIGAGYS